MGGRQYPPLASMALLIAATAGIFCWRRRKNNESEAPAPRRFGGAIRLEKEKYRKYRELHDNIWPRVLERLYQSNVRNFNIYYHEETSTLFSHFEWIGHWKRHSKDAIEEQAWFQQDMDAIASDPITREWWKECEPCQQPFGQWPDTTSRKPPSQGGTGDWWAPLECVAHCGHWPVSYSMQRRDPDFVTLKNKV